MEQKFRYGSFHEMTSTHVISVDDDEYENLSSQDKQAENVDVADANVGALFLFC